VPLKDGVRLFDGDLGWLKVTFGEVVSTVKVLDELVPAGFPSELGSVAVAVYCPLGRAGLALFDVQAPPVAVALAVETTVPLADAPAKIWTVTGSVGSLALPVKDGVVSFEGDFGWFKVTVGELVSTVNVAGALSPLGFPSELSCVATAVYCPLTSDGLALPELHAPPVPVAAALETTVPLAVLPA